MVKGKHGVTVKDRLLRAVKVNKSTGCWEWQGTRNKSGKGYGHLKIKGRTVSAHRVSFSTFKHEIPKGMLVCHKCDNPTCINPEHLFLGTPKDNVLDRDIKGRGIHWGRQTVGVLH